MTWVRVSPLIKTFLCRLFRLCETPIFSYFAKEWVFTNSQRPPFLHFPALCDLPETKKISKKIRREYFYIPGLTCYELCNYQLTGPCRIRRASNQLLSFVAEIEYGLNQFIEKGRSTLTRD